MSPEHKPMIWLGDSRKRLGAFPLTVKKVMGFALRAAQAGEKHADAKSLKLKPSFVMMIGKKVGGRVHE